MQTPEIVKKLSAMDIFNILLWGSMGFYFPLSFIGGLLALFDIVPANLNGNSYTGLKGFLIPVLTSPIFVVLIVCAQWVILAFGMRFIKLTRKLFSGSPKLTFLLGVFVKRN